MSSLRKGYATTFLLLTLFTASFLVTGCSGGDMTTVTINIGNHFAKADRPSIVDRILAFLTFSTRLQADPPSVFFNRIDLTVSGAGMETINRTIPTDTGEITLDVPSGPARVFTIVGYDDADSRLMGGIATKDLAPGGSEIISIMMGDLPVTPNISSMYGGVYPADIQLVWTYGGDIMNLTGFTIYRAPDLSTPIAPEIHGPYIPIISGRKEDFGVSTYTEYIPMSSNSLNKYFYIKITGYNQYGEGEPIYSYDQYYMC